MAFNWTDEMAPAIFIRSCIFSGNVVIHMITANLLATSVPSTQQMMVDQWMFCLFVTFQVYMLDFLN